MVSLIGVLPSLYESYGKPYFWDILQRLERLFMNMEPLLVTLLDELGAKLIGLEHAALIALCIAVFDILPVLGTGGIMIPWMILSALQGNVPLAVKLLILYLVITVIRNIVEPKIVGGQLGLHPVVTLCSMFVGAQLFGAVGLFGFPIGLSLLRHLNDHGVIHIFR